jgi:hypothetical protein
MTLIETDYSVVVKHRAPAPKSWRWEIYRAGRTSPIAHSSVYFQTMTMASRAGKEALKELLDRLHSQRLRWPPPCASSRVMVIGKPQLGQDVLSA